MRSRGGIVTTGGRRSVARRKSLWPKGLRLSTGMLNHPSCPPNTPNVPEQCAPRRSRGFAHFKQDADQPVPPGNSGVSPFLVRKFVLPLIEATLGRETFRIWRELEADPN